MPQGCVKSLKIGPLSGGSKISVQGSGAIHDPWRSIGCLSFWFQIFSIDGDKFTMTLDPNIT